MKKYIVLLFALICMLVPAGCAHEDTGPAEAAETGYPSGEIQQPQIMYNGKLYFYFATGFDEPLPAGYEYAGSITVIDNVNGPSEDFHGARVDPDQEVYASLTHADTVYLKYENGYAQFSAKN